METRLKQIRRAAGDARDYDVLAQRLTDGHSDAEAQRFLEKVRSRRRKAQRPIQAVYRRPERHPLPVPADEKGRTWIARFHKHSSRSLAMAIPHAKSGEVIDLRPLGEDLAHAVTNTLVKTDRLEIIRLVVLAGKDIPPHQVAGEITVQCLEGRVAFTVGNSRRDLEAGQLLYLASEEPHSLHGIEDASVLLTILLR